LTKKQPEDSKLLILPSKLVNRLRETSAKRGTSLTSYAMEVLEEALRAESLGATPKAAVDAYRMREIQRGAGAMVVPRGSLSQLVEDLKGDHAEELKGLWEEAGRWYGTYLSGKLSAAEVLEFLRQDLLTSWNLDEVEIVDGDEATLRFTAFMMSEEFTDLLLSYVHGLMESLGYNEMNRDSLRGMATIKYLKIKKR
jgi:hypothetical protein